MEYLVDKELQSEIRARQAVEAENAEMKRHMNTIYAVAQRITAPKPPAVEPSCDETACPASLSTIRLPVRDAADAAAFLCDVFALLEPTVSENGNSAVVRMGHVRVELHTEPDHDVPPRPAAVYMPFTVHTSSVEAVRSRLVSRKCLWSFAVPGSFRAVKFLDPDGHQWEAVETTADAAVQSVNRGQTQEDVPDSVIPVGDASRNVQQGYDLRETEERATVTES